MEYIDVMLANREASLADILKRMGDRCYMEYKYDGMRMEAHLDKKNKQVTLYSRGGKDITNMFKDIAYALLGSLNVDNAVVDGEIVAYNKETNQILPFQTLMHRKRKNGIDEAIKNVSARVYLYDVLYTNDKECMSEPYDTRKTIIRCIFNQHKSIDYATWKKIDNADDANRFFDEAVAHYCEGVVAKDADSIYSGGKRGFGWIKFKKDYDEGLKDSFDLVIIGYDMGKGKREGTIGSLLVATYSKINGAFQSVCKIGTGYSDDDLKMLFQILSPISLDYKPDSYETKVKMDKWVCPRYLAEVNGADISISPVHSACRGLNGGKGLAIRFSRFIRVRDDKSINEYTTPEEIYRMYQLQESRGKNP